MNCSGVAAPNTGAEMLPICQRSPPGRSNCSARLRWLLALSGALGLPPPTEKRTTTGTGWPLKADAVDSARPSALPTKLPVAHTPLAPERRKPSNLPPTFSKVSTMRLGSTWACAAGAHRAAMAATTPAAAAAVGLVPRCMAAGVDGRVAVVVVWVGVASSSMVILDDRVEFGGPGPPGARYAPSVAPDAPVLTALRQKDRQR